MMIKSEEKNLRVGLHNHETGEYVGEANLTQITSIEKYSIKRLNMKIWDSGLDFVYQEVATSKTNTMIFNTIKNEINKYNEFRSNVTNLANIIDVDGSTIRRMIKKLVDIGFMSRVERGIYVINPFVLQSKGMKKLQDIERIQKEWSEKYGEPNTSLINTNKNLFGEGYR